MPRARGLSPHTIRSYRDAFAMLLRFLAARLDRDVVDLDLCDIDPDGVIAFLEHLETGRGNCAATGLDASSPEPLFRSRRGAPLTRFGVRYLLRKYSALAQSAAPGLACKRVHPHTMRHTAAVHLLQSGVDMVTISHWLGHASVETTNRYAVVDLETKRAALAKAGPVVDDDDLALAAWRSDTSILTWIEAL